MLFPGDAIRASALEEERGSALLESDDLTRFIEGPIVCNLQHQFTTYSGKLVNCVYSAAPTYLLRGKLVLRKL